MYQSAGIQDARTVVQDAEGLRVTVLDHWSSTDGRAHQVRMAYRNGFNNTTATGTNDLVFRFPWNAANPGYDVYSPGEQIPPAPWSSTFFVKKSASLADDDPANIHGAMTFSSPPEAMGMSGSTTVLTTYRRTVPATGSLDLTFLYASGYSDAQTNALVVQQQDAFSAPVVKFTAPADGSSFQNPNVTVAGTAVDNVGVTSFTLNGQPAPLGPDGTFSVPLTLQLGPNTISAAAADAAGNVTQQAITLIYAPDRTPPRLTVSVGRLRLAAFLRKGLTAIGSCNKPCDLVAQLVLDGKTAKKLHISRKIVADVVLGTATAHLTAPGQASLVFTLKPKARKALKKVKTVNLTLNTRATDPAGNVSTATQRITVRR
jgi:hypothetical protein